MLNSNSIVVVRIKHFRSYKIFLDKKLELFDIENIEWQTLIAYCSYKKFNSFYSYMEKRKPYQLKGILAVYNMFQVAACCYLIHGVSILKN